MFDILVQERSSGDNCVSYICFCKRSDQRRSGYALDEGKFVVTSYQIILRSYTLYNVSFRLYRTLSIRVHKVSLRNTCKLCSVVIVFGDTWSLSILIACPSCNATFRHLLLITTVTSSLETSTSAYPLNRSISILQWCYCIVYWHFKAIIPKPTRLISFYLAIPKILIPKSSNKSSF